VNEFLFQFQIQLDGWQLSGRIATIAAHREICILVEQFNFLNIVSFFTSDLKVSLHHRCLHLWFVM